jgi:large subunit ribosomal protein L9
VKVILTQDLDNLGHAGDVKRVADGYARNYLIPQGLAVQATPGALREYENRQAAETRREARLGARAEALSRRLSEVTLVFEAKASETGRLFGSITTADIADALEQQIGEKFDRRKHILVDSLRNVGRYMVPIRLTSEVTAEVKVIVTPEGGDLPPETDLVESADLLAEPPALADTEADV